MERLMRRLLLRFATGEREIRFNRYSPTRETLREKLAAIGSLGIYLHIPFCERICPYCPYNKEIFHADLAQRYTAAVTKEVDIYGELLAEKEITSFYIGGGTPTTMLHVGLPDLIDRIR